MAESQEPQHQQEVEQEQQPAEPQQQAAKLTPEQERVWATFCHLAAFGGLVVPWLGHILGPLIVWLIKRNESDFVDQQGKEALNFQISVTIYAVAAALLVILLVGILLLPAVIIFDIIMVITGAIKANSGEDWRYPLCIRFIQ